MALPRSRFLDAPREIRDLIYEFYVAAEDGYFYDFDSNKLRTREGQPINLSLMYTCRSVAAEMRGLALGQNTITFSTHEATGELASRVKIYGQMCRIITWIQPLHVGSVLGSMLATNTGEKMAKDFPWFGSRIDAAMRFNNESVWQRSNRASEFYRGRRGHGLSLQNQANARALELASAAGQQYIDELDLYIQQDRQVYFSHDFQSSVPVARLGYLKPWVLPTEERLSELDRSGAFDRRVQRGPFKRPTARLSAAAVCAHFLASTPADKRSQLRRIVLNEDLPALKTLFPECHAQGLIPFCVENPLLRVERRVSIWNVVVHDSLYTSLPPVDLFSDKVALWIVEAHDLASLGMPAGSYSMLLDGDPTPEHTAHLFQTIVHRDIAWQQAIEAWQVLKPQPRPITWHTAYDELPAVMLDITSGKSNIRCNFDPGYPVDFQTVVNEHRLSTRHEFKKAYSRRSVQYPFFHTVPPLPDFRTLSHQVWNGPNAGPCPPRTQEEIDREEEEREHAQMPRVYDSD